VETPRSTSSFDEIFRHRANMLEAKEEKWRRRSFYLRVTMSGVVARLRRFFDLQAGSIWNDLARLLPHAEGAVLDVGCGAQPYRELFTSLFITEVSMSTREVPVGYKVRIRFTMKAIAGRWPMRRPTLFSARRL